MCVIAVRFVLSPSIFVNTLERIVLQKKDIEEKDSHGKRVYFPPLSKRFQKKERKNCGN